MVSYSLILSTENGTQTTRGNPADYTWSFDWSEFEDGNYEMIYTFLSDNLNQVATFNDINRPCLNLDLGGILPNAFEVVDAFTSRRSQHIGFLRSEIQSTTNGIFFTGVNSTPNGVISFYDQNGNSTSPLFIQGQTYALSQATGAGDTNTGTWTTVNYTHTGTGIVSGLYNQITVSTNQLCSQLQINITPPVIPNIAPALANSYVYTTVKTATTNVSTFVANTAVYLDAGSYTLTGNANTTIGTLTLGAGTTYAANATITFAGGNKSLAAGSPVIFTLTANLPANNYPIQVLATGDPDVSGGNTTTIATSTTASAGATTNTIVLSSAITLINGVPYIVYQGATVASPQVGIIIGTGVNTATYTFAGNTVSYASGDSFAFYPASNLNVVGGTNYNTVYLQTATTLVNGKTYSLKQNNIIVGTVVGTGIAIQQYTITNSTAQITPNFACSFIPITCSFTSATLFANIVYSAYVGTTYIGSITQSVDTAYTALQTSGASPLTSLYAAGTLVSFIPPTTNIYVVGGATLLKDIQYNLIGTGIPANPPANFIGTGLIAYNFTLPTPTVIFGSTNTTFVPYQLPLQDPYASSAPITTFSFPSRIFPTTQAGTYNAAGEGIEATYDALSVYSPTVTITTDGTTAQTTGTFSTAQTIINGNIELSLLNGATTGVCQLYTNINDNPPVFYRILGNTTGKIRIWLTSPASLGLNNQNQVPFSVPGLGNWSMVLRFTKVDKVKNSSSYQVVDDVLFSK